MTFAAYRRYLDEQNKPRKRKKQNMLRHTLTHPYTDDDNDPDTDSFYRMLLDLMSELTEIATDNDQGLEMEYGENLTRLILWRHVTYNYGQGG